MHVSLGGTGQSRRLRFEHGDVARHQPSLQLRACCGRPWCNARECFPLGTGLWWLQHPPCAWGAGLLHRRGGRFVLRCGFRLGCLAAALLLSHGRLLLSCSRLLHCRGGHLVPLCGFRRGCLAAALVLSRSRLLLSCIRLLHCWGVHLVLRCGFRRGCLAAALVLSRSRLRRC